MLAFWAADVPVLEQLRQVLSYTSETRLALKVSLRHSIWVIVSGKRLEYLEVVFSFHLSNYLAKDHSFELLHTPGHTGDHIFDFDVLIPVSLKTIKAHLL